MVATMYQRIIYFVRENVNRNKKKSFKYQTLREFRNIFSEAITLTKKKQNQTYTQPY
jgi:hypothetical protein